MYTFHDHTVGNHPDNHLQRENTRPILSLIITEMRSGAFRPLILQSNNHYIENAADYKLVQRRPLTERKAPAAHAELRTGRSVHHKDRSITRVSPVITTSKASTTAPHRAP